MDEDTETMNPMIISGVGACTPPQSATESEDSE